MINREIDARSNIEKRAFVKFGHKYQPEFATIKESIAYYCECLHSVELSDYCTCDEHILPDDEHMYHCNIYITKFRHDTDMYARIISKIRIGFDSEPLSDSDSDSDGEWSLDGPHPGCKKCSEAEWFGMYIEYRSFNEYIAPTLSSIVLSDGKWYDCGLNNFHDEICIDNNIRYDMLRDIMRNYKIMPQLYAEYNKAIRADRLDIISKVMPLLLSDATSDVPFEVIGVIAVILYQL